MISKSRVCSYKVNNVADDQLNRLSNVADNQPTRSLEWSESGNLVERIFREASTSYGVFLFFDTLLRAER